MASRLVLGRFSTVGINNITRKSNVFWSSLPLKPKFQSTTTTGVPIRKKVSLEEREALRAARRERASKALQEQTGKENSGSATGGGVPSGRLLSSGASKWTFYLGIGIPSALLFWALNDENSPPAQFARLIGLTAMIERFSEDIAKPSHEKLLPDWSQMPNVPHDIPVPHTLVLDLEYTLVSATWDRKHGWRYAKRPGVDKFLMDMAQYFEIVLYSPSIDAVAMPVVQKLDKNGCIMHQLYRDATYYKNGVHVKDLSRLNRNVKRMVVLDDDMAEVQFNPENVIKVKPYTDPNDRTDNTLERITPFLLEIAREGYNDIPTLLQQYQGMDADGIADEQERRIKNFVAAREHRASRGLGGLAMSARRSNSEAPELPAVETDFTPSQLTAKDLVGAAPPSAAQDAGLMGFLNRRQKEKEENDKRKYEKWNEVMIKKQRERETNAKAA